MNIIVVNRQTQNATVYTPAELRTMAREVLKTAAIRGAKLQGFHVEFVEASRANSVVRLVVEIKGQDGFVHHNYAVL